MKVFCLRHSKYVTYPDDKLWQTVMLICFHKDTPDRRDPAKSFASYIVERLAALPTEINAGEGEKKLRLQREKLFIPILVDAYKKTTSLFKPYMADIVGNTICADYLDYLRRDALNVGLDVLREERVLSNFYVCVDPKVPK